MLHKITSVKHIGAYQLQLHFHSGEIRLIDFENRLKNAKNMFLPLKDIEYFKKVTCDGTTIVWPNGLDLCPDVLYENSKPATVKVKHRNRKLPSRRNSSDPSASSGDLSEKGNQAVSA